MSRVQKRCESLARAGAKPARLGSPHGYAPTRTMVKPYYLVSLAFALVLLSGCFGGGASEPNVEAAAPSAGQASDTSAPARDFPMATNFVMTTLEGEELSLESQRGHYVLVNFWATWCVPCREEMPYLQQLSDDYDGELTVLGVNLNEDAERVAPFIDEMGLTFPILLDPPDELLAEHNVRGLPISYVVDPEGAIVHRVIGEIRPKAFDAWLAQADGLTN